jgi:site-specific DNA-methyltransferase (adenine-specific)
MSNWTLYEGDCFEVMRELPDNSVDAIVTDPPYGLSREPDIEEVLRHWLAGDDYQHRGGGFMGKTWDSFVPGPAVWREVFRVVKPGGHILCFAGTRTVDLMSISLRLGGFEIRDCLQWLYGSGFPKSLDVSKAFDKHAGVEREIIGVKISPDGKPQTSRVPNSNGRYHVESHTVMNSPTRHNPYITKPVTELAKKWNGWGTALKPAVEPIILARKPLSEATVAENVLKWGTGGLNIDGCRIGTEVRNNPQAGFIRRGRTDEEVFFGTDKNRPEGTVKVTGRFPANVILDEEAGRMLDEQQEGASRFFYVAKASRSERTHGGKVENNHPTVKPIKLMRYLCRLITPPGGTVLDPFAGSGTTLIAAVEEGFSVIGIEREPEYCEIIRKRMAELQPALPLVR